LSRSHILKVVLVGVFYHIYNFGINILTLKFFNGLKLNVKVSSSDFLIFAITTLVSIEMMVPTVGCYILENLNDQIRLAIKNEKPSEELLRLVSTVYLNVCEAFDCISDFYTPILLLDFLIACYNNVFNSYTIFVFLKLGGSKLLHFSVLTFCWAVLGIPLILWIIKCSSDAQKQSMKTLSLIMQLASKRKSSRALKSSRILELLMSHQVPKITCGSLTLNWNFLFSMIGWIFSFSIIVIQFSDV
jgi:7tm Chemosensory receptor